MQPLCCHGVIVPCNRHPERYNSNLGTKGRGRKKDGPRVGEGLLVVRSNSYFSFHCDRPNNRTEK